MLYKYKILGLEKRISIQYYRIYKPVNLESVIKDVKGKDKNFIKNSKVKLVLPVEDKRFILGSTLNILGIFSQKFGVIYILKTFNLNKFYILQENERETLQ